jgi:diaminopimelate epimerase
MKCHLYDAAGNRVLWIDARAYGFEGDFGRQRNLGARLSAQFHFGQEITAVLFGSDSAARVWFWNPDGSFEAICGNAIRCLAHFMADNLDLPEVIRVETPRASYLSRRISAHFASVVIPESAVRVTALGDSGDIAVDLGTPHRIRLVQTEWPGRDVADAKSHSEGSDPVNFDLVRQVSPNHFRARVFERGVGETFSCGTAAASIVAAFESKTSCPDSSGHYRVEFASGEELVVCHDRLKASYEIGGRVSLVRDLST